MMKIDATLSLSYRSNNDMPVVHITIREEKSRLEIFDGEISYEQFTAALSSLQVRPFVEAEFDQANAPNIGKYLHVKTGTILAPNFGFGIGNDVGKKYEEWLRQHGGEPGWQFDTSLSSQDSRTTTPDGVILKYRLYRYLETEQVREVPKRSEDEAPPKTKQKSRRTPKA